MKVYNLEGITVKDILEELSQQMETSLKENFTEYTLKIPEELGEGEIQGINFPNGVGLLKFKGKFKKQVVLHLKSSDVHPLKFIYGVKGELTHSIKPDGERKFIQELQSAIVATYFNYGHIYKFPVNEEFYFQSVEIDRKKFRKHIDYQLEDMPYYFYKIFADVEGVQPLFYKSNYSLKIAQLIEEMETFAKEGLIRVNYLGAKALEILALMLSQFEDDQKDNQDQRILRKSEIKTIAEIAEFINKNYAQFENIDKLAQEFGLSKGKIQQGFQSAYQQTINEYLVRIRLEKALELLNEGEKNISEIVYEIGLSSRSYFSKIFKERFKITPSDYAKRN